MVAAQHERKDPGAEVSRGGLEPVPYSSVAFLVRDAVTRDALDGEGALVRGEQPFCGAVVDSGKSGRMKSARTAMAKLPVPPMMKSHLHPSIYLLPSRPEKMLAASSPENAVASTRPEYSMAVRKASSLRVYQHERR